VPVSRTERPREKKHLAPEQGSPAQDPSLVVCGRSHVGDTTKTFSTGSDHRHLGSAARRAETIAPTLASLDQFKDAKVVVKPQAEETVSPHHPEPDQWGSTSSPDCLTFALKRAVTDVVKLDTAGLSLPRD